MIEGRMKTFIRAVRYLVLFPLAVPMMVPGCTAEPTAPPMARSSAVQPEVPREIYVASNGWHSAIFVDAAAISTDALPEAADFPKAAFLGFGWGDADYFPARDPGVLALLTAALQPTPSVIHVTGLPSHPRAAFPDDEVIAVPVSPDGLEALLAFLNKVFIREGRERASMVAPGLHRFSKFYSANGKFHLFNNCNRWTARALAAAGISIEPDGIVRAESLMASLRAMAK